MKAFDQGDIELPRIKRPKNSWAGKVIQYLMEHPSGNLSYELAIEAIAAYWLVEALENNVQQQQLVVVSRNASEKLQGKLATIRRIIEHPIKVDSSYTDIKNEENTYVELSRVKRAKDSWEGQVIQYLLECPSNKPTMELVLEAITAYWIVEALLDNNARYSEVAKASRMAIEKLEAKLKTINKIMAPHAPQTIGLQTNPKVDVANRVVTVFEPDSRPYENSPPSTLDEESDDEDWSDFLDDETLLLANILGS